VATKPAEHRTKNLAFFCPPPPITDSVISGWRGSQNLIYKNTTQWLMSLKRPADISPPIREHALERQTGRELQTAQKSDVTLNGHRIAITAPACSRPPR
jgi:hypothetical protein